MSTNLPAFIDYFLQPQNYDHPVEQVSLVQTHISFVLIAGEFVYKFKKPVDFGFLNFSSLAKRQFYCQEELSLNKRLCPDIYLDLISVGQEGDNFNLQGQGEVVEYAVKMKKMPLERMMSEVIAAGELDEKVIDQIVAILVPFYEKANASDDIAKFGKADAVAVNVTENFEQTAGFIGCPSLNQEQFDLIKNYSEKFLENTDLFQARSESKVRDCHGDLYSANICLADTVYIFDCIEFNERFRYCDVASDVAFLAMDLDYQGLPDLSNYFIEQFCQKSDDEQLKVVLNFYKCYRAFVRGKIGLFTANAPEVDNETVAKAFADAKKYFSLATSYAS